MIKMNSRETTEVEPGTYPNLQVPDAPSESCKVSQAGAEAQYRTYPGRFYVLIVTALLCMQQNIAWLTFGPIPQEAKDKYGLTDIEITLLPGKLNMDYLWENVRNVNELVWVIVCVGSLCVDFLNT